MLNVEKIVFIHRVFYSRFDIIADNANVARPRRRLVTRGKINRTVSNVFETKHRRAVVRCCCG